MTALFYEVEGGLVDGFIFCCRWLEFREDNKMNRKSSESPH